MFELTEIADNGEIQPRVFPIVLDDANIYEAMGRLDYILHWEQKKEELDKKMKKAGGEYLRAISEELNLYEKTRNTIDGLLDILGNMNALTPEQHKAGGFDELLRALQNRLAE
jgi:hypothetical protein